MPQINILNIVLLLPPAPAALVLDGRAFATLSALSAAAFLLIAVAGPPGGFGDAGRAVVVPVDAGEFTGDCGRGADYKRKVVLVCSHSPTWFGSGRVHSHSHARKLCRWGGRWSCAARTYHCDGGSRGNEFNSGQ